MSASSANRTAATTMVRGVGGLKRGRCLGHGSVFCAVRSG
jgi:hypothetical protein